MARCDPDKMKQTLVGEATAKVNTADRRFAGVKYRSEAPWDYALGLDAENPGAFRNLLDGGHLCRTQIATCFEKAWIPNRSLLSRLRQAACVR